MARQVPAGLVLWPTQSRKLSDLNSNRRYGLTLPVVFQQAKDALRHPYFDDLDKAAIDALLYERDKLAVGALIPGPAIVEQFDATTVIPAGWTGRVDGYHNLILERLS